MLLISFKLWGKLRSGAVRRILEVLVLDVVLGIEADPVLLISCKLWGKLGSDAAEGILEVLASVGKLEVGV